MSRVLHAKKYVYFLQALMENDHFDLYLEYDVRFKDNWTSTFPEIDYMQLAWTQYPRKQKQSMPWINE